MSKVIALFEQYVKLSNNLHYDAMLAAVRVEDPGKLADTIASHLVLAVEEKQNLLEIFSPQERLQRILAILEAEVDKLQVDKRIQGRVKKQMERAQKEYYLNEKMKAIQKELGRKDDRLNEVEELRKKIELAAHAQGGRGAGPPGAEAPGVDAAHVRRGHRLAQLPRLADRGAVVASARASARTCWRAEKILNEDHYGLEKVKERIVEFLAVRQLVNKPKGPILCFVGPSRRGQDLARQVHRPLHQPQVRAHVAGRRARRGRDPRPPPHLHRRLPRPDHPDDEEGGRRATRSSCSTKWTRCRWTSAATPRRPCWRCWTPSRTTASPTTTSTWSSTSRRSSSSPPPTCCTPSPRPCRTAWRCCACPATPSARRSRSPSAT